MRMRQNWRRLLAGVLCLLLCLPLQNVLADQGQPKSALALQLHIAQFVTPTIGEKIPTAEACKIEIDQDVVSASDVTCGWESLVDGQAMATKVDDVFEAGRTYRFHISYAGDRPVDTIAVNGENFRSLTDEQTQFVSQEFSLQGDDTEEKSHDTEDQKAPTVLYLNGKQGADENDGRTKETAVASFERAKQLATENPSITAINVTDMVKISGDVSLAGTNAKVYRDPDYKGIVFLVDKDTQATLHDIVVDGNRKVLSKEQLPTEPLIKVDHAMLRLNTGSEICNNQRAQEENKRSLGGGIYVYYGTLEMDGGDIHDNSATDGAGVCLMVSTMNMKDGHIHHNHAYRLFDTSVRQIYASGGGVLLDEGSSLTMEGGDISDNISDEIGGGVSVGSIDWSSRPDQFVMKNGHIDRNSAGSAGGGIFVQAGLDDRVSKAIIEAGSISENVMTGMGRTNKAFGGGGIYVNGMPKKFSGSTWCNGELHIKNVAIYDNESVLPGGGLAACPISKSYIYATDGGAIYHNRRKNGEVNAKDIYILSSPNYGIHSGQAEIDISEKMLGGKDYEW